MTRLLWLSLLAMLVAGCNHRNHPIQGQQAYDIRFAMRPWPAVDPHWPNKSGEQLWGLLADAYNRKAFGVSAKKDGDGLRASIDFSIPHHGATLHVQSCCFMWGGGGEWWDYKAWFTTSAGDCPGDGAWIDTMQAFITVVSDSIGKLDAHDNAVRESTYAEHGRARDSRIAEWKASNGY